MRILSAPARVVWEVTKQCNLRCQYCYLDAGIEASDELPPDVILDLAETLGRANVFHITLSGGEPLLRADIFQIAALLTQLGVSVYLNSNGTLITPYIAREIKKAGIKGVAVSLDGTTASVHDLIRPPQGSFEKTISGIEILRRIGIDVGLQTTITLINHHQMLEMADLGIALGVKGVKFSRVSPVGRGREGFESLELPYGIAQPLIESLYRQRKALTGKIRIDFGENLISEFLISSQREGLDHYVAECEAGRFKCAIGAEGSVRPCEFFTDTRYIAGNLRLLPLEQIWRDSPVFKYFRTDQLYGDCAVCRKHCTAKCPAAAVYRGDHTMQDPTCPYLLLKRSPHSPATATGSL